jgi:hypothetical protein
MSKECIYATASAIYRKIIFPSSSLILLNGLPFMKVSKLVGEEYSIIKNIFFSLSTV